MLYGSQWISVFHNEISKSFEESWRKEERHKERKGEIKKEKKKGWKKEEENEGKKAGWTKEGRKEETVNTVQFNIS